MYLHTNSFLNTLIQLVIDIAEIHSFYEVCT